MPNKPRPPIPSSFGSHEGGDNEQDASHIGEIEEVHGARTMPSISSVMRGGDDREGADIVPPISPTLKTHLASSKSLPFGGRGMSGSLTLDRAAMARGSTRSLPGAPTTPKTPASTHLEAERNRFFNFYTSQPVTPLSLQGLYTSCSCVPQAGLYKASINTSLTNVVLKSRKPFSKRHAPSTLTETPIKPWLEDKDRKKSRRVAFWTFLGSASMELVAAALLMYFAWASVPRDKYCLILEEHFDQPGGLNRSIWTFEQQTDGYGNGQFEWTTDSINNTFVEDGKLYIVPTLTADHVGEAAILNGYTLNLTASGTCTASNKTDATCAVASNSTTGVILPPIQSARISTNMSASIKYGRVEVRARMPTGDWLWPAIWMLPKDNVYGEWPRSGEIDIVETKGNMHSTLHYGPDWLFDGYGIATKIRKLWRKYLNQDFHTFGLEWTEENLFTWERSPVWRNLQVNFNPGGFWKLGQFPQRMGNGTLLDDPWADRPEPYARSAPFDQEFYLILNVAVGGNNGFFQDRQGDNKPWSNDAANPRAQSWDSRDQRLPTWPKDPRQRGMAVDYVKMWQKC